jgi:hypothetical protein
MSSRSASLRLKYEFPTLQLTHVYEVQTRSRSSEHHRPWLALAIVAALAISAQPQTQAVPLSVLIGQESAKLHVQVEAFNKECGGDKSFVGDPCMKRRYKLSGDLGQFVALVNDELSFLSDGDSWDARRNLMLFEVRDALYNIKCLGRSDKECTDEAKALQADPVAKEAVAMRAGADEEAKHWHLVKVVSTTPEQDFVANFVKAFGSNNLDAQLQYYADRVDYYERGQVSKEIIRKDLEHDIATWPNRNYSMPDPKITITPNGDGFTAEFRMRYTLTNPKGTSSGTLQMTVRLKPQAQNWQVVGIQKKVIQATK